MPITSDRRRLWTLANTLAVNATLDIHHRIVADLTTYLRTTCDHFWVPLPADYYAIGPGWIQCRYCHHVQLRRITGGPITGGPMGDHQDASQAGGQDAGQDTQPGGELRPQVVVVDETHRLFDVGTDLAGPVKSQTPEQVAP